MSSSNMHMSSTRRHHFARPSHHYKRHTRVSSESPGTSDSAATTTWHQSSSECHNTHIYIYIHMKCKGDLATFTTSSNSSTLQHNTLGQHADSATIIPSSIYLYPYTCKPEYQNDYNITNMYRWITLRTIDTLDDAYIRINMHGRLLTHRNHRQSDVFLRVTHSVSKHHNPVSLCIYT
jgi:hypothetical protein